MAIKTFTTGEVLTAADTNTFLANAGLDYVGGASVSNVATIDVTGFTTTYNQFRVVYALTRHSGTGTSAITAQFRDATSGYTTTGYYGAGVTSNFTGTVASYAARNNAADFAVGNVYDNVATERGAFDVGGMNTMAVRPTVSGSVYDTATTAAITYGYEYAGGRTLTIDRIRLSCAVGMTGTWRLYGYRQA